MSTATGALLGAVGHPTSCMHAHSRRSAPDVTNGWGLTSARTSKAAGPGPPSWRCPCSSRHPHAACAHPDPNRPTYMPALRPHQSAQLPTLRNGTASVPSWQPHVPGQSSTSHRNGISSNTTDRINNTSTITTTTTGRSDTTRSTSNVNSTTAAHSSTQHTAAHPPTPPTNATSRRSFLLSVAAAAATAAAAAAAAPLILPRAASAAAISGRPPPGPLGFESRVVEFTLANGMHFIVLPRRNAPVVSCHTLANVGAWQEAPGCTGIAHLLEHMAFKGTPRTGSVDFPREAALLDSADEVFYQLRDLQDAADPAAPQPSRRAAALAARLRELQGRAGELTVPNAFGALLQSAGGVGLNATTSHDATRYFVSLPANKLELWVAAEAERFRAPVFRELYSEKAVVEEERRLRVDNSPMGRYQQDFALAALASPYRRPVIGFERDFSRIGRREVQAFFDRFYGPANLTVTLVGDVEPEAVHRLAERYWGEWSGAPGYLVQPRGASVLATPTTPTTSATRTTSNATTTTTTAAMAGAGAAGAGDAGWWGAGEEDPRPEAFRSGALTSLAAAAPSGPAALLAFYRPPLCSREGVALGVAADCLAGGRTSRLVSELVLRGRALSATVVADYPGERHAGLALVYGIPKEGDSPEDVAALLRSQLAALAEGGVRGEELRRVTRGARAGLLAAAQSNSALAASLAAYHVNNGSWRGLVEELELVSQVDAEEVRQVAARVFAPDNCFTGYVLKA